MSLINRTTVCDIDDWIDNIVTAHERQPATFSALRPPTPPGNTENSRPRKRRRVMEEDLNQTPRPSKRARDMDGTPFFPPSPTKSSAAASETSEVESHRSGRLSPVKQLQLLEDEDQPVVFCNFDDDQGSEEPADVTAMRSAVQQYADGVGILGYDDVNAVTTGLVQVDRMRFQYPWANNREQRCALGSMPPVSQIQDIVETAQKYDRGAGVSEDEWNAEVQNLLLKLARGTSKHRRTLDIHNV